MSDENSNAVKQLVKAFFDFYDPGEEPEDILFEIRGLLKICFSDLAEAGNIKEAGKFWRILNAVRNSYDLKSPGALPIDNLVDLALHRRDDKEIRDAILAAIERPGK